jgi:hypothetical protein
MPDLVGTDNKGPISRQLYDLASHDLETLNEWRRRTEEFSELRIGARKKRVLPYPTAPNFTVPIIDDNIRNVVAQKMRALFQPKHLASFLPLNATAQDMRSKMEMAFQSLFRMIPNFRAHIENAFQNMEETGLAFLVFTLDSTSYRRFMRTSEDFIIPAFVSEHPYNIILPPDTKFIDDTDRYVRVLKFTPDQFEVKAKENPDWPRDTVRKILDMKRALPQGDASGDSQELSLYGYQPRVSGETTDRVDPTIYLHEAAYTKEGKRRFNKYSVDLPDEQLEDVEWSWEEEPDRTREWPLVACVAERRNLEIMDSRS